MAYCVTAFYYNDASINRILSFTIFRNAFSASLSGCTNLLIAIPPRFFLQLYYLKYTPTPQLMTIHNLVILSLKQYHNTVTPYGIHTNILHAENHNEVQNNLPLRNAVTSSSLMAFLFT